MKSKKAVTIALGSIILIAVIFSVYYFFIRDDKGKNVAKLVEMTVPVPTQNITSNIEEVMIEKSMLKKDVMMIKGWAFKQNVKEKTREMYLVLKAEDSTMVFDLENDNLPRPDVTKYFKMTGGADNHGFDGYIPLDNLKDSSYRIGFIIKDASGQYFSMSQKKLVFSDGSVKLNDSKFLENRVSIPIQPTTDKIQYNLEKCDFSGNKVNIRGWANLEGMNTDSMKTYIVLKNTKTTAVFSVVVETRKDVTIYYKKTGLNLDLSGFTCMIEGGDLEAGKYQVCIYIVSGSVAGFIYSHNFVDIVK